MKHLTLSVLALVFLSTTSNAQSSVILPDHAVAPAFQEAKELKLAISFQPHPSLQTTSTTGPSIDIAYAPTGHLMVAGSYHAILDLPEPDLYLSGPYEFAKIKGNSFEGGAGYFRTMGKQGHAEVLVAYGNGSLQRRNRGTGEVLSDIYDTHYHSFTVQPATGIKTGGLSLEAGFSYRLRSFYEFDDASSKESMISGSYSTIGTFINMEAGSNLVRFNVQAGAYNPVGGSAFSNLRTYISAGLAFRFAPDEHACVTNNSFIVSY